MKLRKFLFGDKYNSESVYTMNAQRPTPNNNAGSGMGSGMDMGSGMGAGSCNLPRRDSYQNDIFDMRGGVLDRGNEPLVFNILSVCERNPYFRAALWTGQFLQLTVMNIPAGEEIGLELHDDTDQFLFVESGTGEVHMGRTKDRFPYQEKISPSSAVIIPAGMWHNIKNTGKAPLKLFSIYAPPHHPYGTMQTKKED